MTVDLDHILKSLPDKRYYEYAYHKFFNPGVTYEHWKPDYSWTYPDRDLLRFSHIITQQLPHIRNKNILDLGCHLGYVSLFCLHNGAKSVIGTNVRQRELEIAAEICDLAGYNNHSFVYSDIDDLIYLGSLCDSVDTVFMCGLLYHLDNHMDVLEVIRDSRANTLIIESEVHHQSEDLPCLIFDLEDTDQSTNKWQPGKTKAFVGTPNRTWILTALEHIGYDITYDEGISYLDPKGSTKHRLIVTAEKKEKHDAQSQRQGKQEKTASHDQAR